MVEGVLSGEVGDSHRLGLSLPVQAGVGLLIQLQRPGQREPHEQMPTLLEVQPMPSGGRVNQAETDVAVIPRLDISCRFEFFGLWEPVTNFSHVVAVPIRH